MEKQAKENSIDSGGGGPTKDNNYIHMRTKRGQTTNSHSLAEMVRRERISERMKLLQELVPGCNKVPDMECQVLDILSFHLFVPNVKSSLERATLELKYQKLYEPLYSKDVLF
ncbi:hypothetical protein Ccrd_019978 [Cynara cardunculus var. scolymus]|uniref:BHLH domain-containing protein n=1 Tax=Cynara cardunculus var. scolymus TaxID=59895 RepID=A0A124SF07_CYNCS|nr:hypothetical protein Ccrd_019978 [Cynara cardunculus var. scolymus]